MHIKKQSVLFVMMILLATCSWAAAYSGGTGEPNDPYIIATAEDMNEIGANPHDWDAHFLLVADINLADYTGTQFNIIGTDYSHPFAGVFNGNEHTISNFTYDSNNTDSIGLFGFVDSGAEVRNLVMENVNINGGRGRVIGGLAGVNNGIFLNCYVSGTISGDQAVGGLAGIHSYGTISGCSVKGSVSGNAYYIGGLVGWNDSVILNSYAECIVLGASGIGGLAGMHSSGTISNCYATGTVEGDSSIGGLVGEGDWGDVFNCYATAIVGGSTYLGALIGYSLDTFFSSCFWDKDVNPSIGGAGDIVDPNGIIDETTENMKKQSTFTDASWEFIEIWNIGENQTYPFLRVYPAGDINHDDIVNFYDLAILAGRWLEGL